MRSTRKESGFVDRISSSHCRASFTILALLFLSPRLLLAQSERSTSDYTLDWKRGPGTENCIVQEELAAKVKSILPSALLVDSDSASTVIRGEIAKENDEFLVVVTSLSEEGGVRGRRQLRKKVEDCRTLDDSIALVVALTIDPHASLLPNADPIKTKVSEAADPINTEGSEDYSALEVNPSQASSSPEEDPGQSSRSGHADSTDHGTKDNSSSAVPRSSAHPYFYLGGAFDSYFGLMPNIGVGPNINGAVRYQAIALELDIAVLPDVYAQEESGRATRSLAVFVDVSFCGTYDPSLLLLALCLGLHTGMLATTGVGFDNDVTTTHGLLGANFSLRAGIALSDHFALVLRPRLLIPFVRPQRTYIAATGIAEPLWQLGSFGFSLALGLRWTFS